MIGLKVVIGDPGFYPDFFGVVGAQYHLQKHKIQWKLAKQFHKKNSKFMSDYFKQIKKTIKPNFMAIETNRREDKNLLKAFRKRYGMPWMHGVVTSAHLSEETRQKGFTMDKPFMVGWFADAQKDHLFEFPSVPSKDMIAFMDQIPQIVPYTTPAGLTGYRAMRGRHDDLFIAALHCCNFIRLFIEQQERLK